MKDEIRPFYYELQGYLKEAPLVSSYPESYDTSLVDNLNDLIDKVSKIIEEDYARFRVKISPATGPTEFDSIGCSARFLIQEYRTKLRGMISHLHGKFFANEGSLLIDRPSTVITSTQTQNQSVDVYLLLTIQSKIDEQLSKFEEGSKEKTFLQKLKESLVNVKDGSQLLSNVVNTAKSLGLSLDNLLKIFG